MTDAERQKRRYDRKKAGLVLVQEWVPAECEAAVRAAITVAIAAFSERAPTGVDTAMPERRGGE